MFCKKCGFELEEETVFCSKCGTNQQDNSAGGAPNSTYRAPNFEFRTVRCYPSDVTENMYKEFYEGCGWQIIDMDRKQVFEGQSSDGTRHYSTQTHIKMQRDKNLPNYERIKSLSDKAEEYFDTTSKANSVGAGIKSFLVSLWILGPMAVFFGVILGFMFGSVPASTDYSAPDTLEVPFSFEISLPCFIIGFAAILTAIIVRRATSKRIASKKAALMEIYNKGKEESDKAFFECKRLVESALQ